MALVWAPRVLLEGCTSSLGQTRCTYLLYVGRCTKQSRSCAPYKQPKTVISEASARFKSKLPVSAAESRRFCARTKVVPNKRFLHRPRTADSQATKIPNVRTVESSVTAPNAPSFVHRSAPVSFGSTAEWSVAHGLRPRVLFLLLNFVLFVHLVQPAFEQFDQFDDFGVL